MKNKIQLKYNEEKTKFVKAVSKLDTLSPLKTLARGYSVITFENGKVAKSVKQLNKNDNINIRLSDGTIKGKII